MGGGLHYWGRAFPHSICVPVRVLPRTAKHVERALRESQTPPPPQPRERAPQLQYPRRGQGQQPLIPDLAPKSQTQRGTRCPGGRHPRPRENQATCRHPEEWRKRGANQFAEWYKSLACGKRLQTNDKDHVGGRHPHHPIGAVSSLPTSSQEKNHHQTTKTPHKRCEPARSSCGATGNGGDHRQ